MTISSTVRKAGPYACNGVTVIFGFTFKVFQASDMKVVHTNAALVENTLALNADYSVLLNADQNATPGGSIKIITVPYPTGDLITVTSVVPNLQPTDLSNQGGFYPSVLTDALDRAEIQIQQVAEGLSRAVQVPLSSSVLPQDYLTTVTAQASAASASASAAASSASTAAASASSAGISAAIVVNWSYVGAWATAIAYLKNQIVSQAGSSYICLVNHTSGTFSADYSAGKWGTLAMQGAAGTGTGDMIRANNLSDVVDVPSARTNLAVPSKSEIQSQTYVAFTTTGIAPAYVITPTPVVAALAAGQRWRLKFHASGAAGTLAVSGLVAKNIMQYTSTGAKTPANPVVNQLADLEFDGTDFVLLDPLPPAAVASVAGAAPIASSGGVNPSISIPPASAGANGYMSAAYASKLDGIQAGATAGVPQDVGVFGVGVMRTMQFNQAGATVASGGTTAGGYLAPIEYPAGVFTPGATGVPGTWRSLASVTLNSADSGLFQRVA